MKLHAGSRLVFVLTLGLGLRTGLSSVQIGMIMILPNKVSGFL